MIVAVSYSTSLYAADGALPLEGRAQFEDNYTGYVAILHKTPDHGDNHRELRDAHDELLARLGSRRYFGTSKQWKNFDQNYSVFLSPVNPDRPKEGYEIVVENTSPRERGVNSKGWLTAADLKAIVSAFFATERGAIYIPRKDVIVRTLDEYDRAMRLPDSQARALSPRSLHHRSSERMLYIQGYRTLNLAQQQPPSVSDEPSKIYNGLGDSQRDGGIMLYSPTESKSAVVAY